MGQERNTPDPVKDLDVEIIKNEGRDYEKIGFQRILFRNFYDSQIILDQNR